MTYRVRSTAAPSTGDWLNVRLAWAWLQRDKPLRRQLSRPNERALRVQCAAFAVVFVLASTGVLTIGVIHGRQCTKSRCGTGGSQATATRGWSELNGLCRNRQAELRSGRIRQGLKTTW